MSWVSTGTSTPTLLERLSVRLGPSCLRVPPTPTCWPSSPSPWRGTWPSAGLSMCFLSLILRELFWCLLYAGQQLCWLLFLISSSQGTAVFCIFLLAWHKFHQKGPSFCGYSATTLEFWFSFLKYMLHPAVSKLKQKKFINVRNK